MGVGQRYTLTGNLPYREEGHTCTVTSFDVGADRRPTATLCGDDVQYCVGAGTRVQLLGRWWDVVEVTLPARPALPGLLGVPGGKVVLEEVAEGAPEAQVRRRLWQRPARPGGGRP